VSFGPIVAGGLKPLIAGPEGALFSIKNTGERFVVVVGNKLEREWVDVVTPQQLESLSEIVESYHSDYPYYHYSKRPSRETTGLDQISKFLVSRKKVFVSIVRGIKRGERVFFVDIDIRDTIRTDWTLRI
jgi:hypothetical protein